MDQDSQAQSGNGTQANDDIYGRDLTYEEIIEKDVLDLMGFTTMSEEKKQKYRQLLDQLVEDRVAARIHDKLSEQDRKEWLDLIEAKKDQEVNDYLMARDINLASWFAQEAILLKLELYEDAKQVRQQSLKVLEEEKQDAAR